MHDFSTTDDIRKACVGNMDGFHWYSDSRPADYEKWCFVYSEYGESVLEESNYTIIYNRLKDKYPDDIIDMYCSHWMVGHINHIAVRAFDDKDELTQAMMEVQDIYYEMNRYPILDEGDYLDRCMTATLDSLKMYIKDKERVYDLLNWFDENHINPMDCEYDLYDNDDVGRGMEALGLEKC